jgi:ribosomal protein S18 acetylase RimI-like enzyme
MLRRFRSTGIDRQDAPTEIFFGGTMLFRPMVESDLDRVLSCTVNEPLRWADPARVRSSLANGNYRFDRIWIALDDAGKLVARAVWWGFPGGHPLTIDCVHVADSVADRIDVAARLLHTAHQEFTRQGMTELPEYHMFLANGWRDDPAAVNAVTWRTQALNRLGATAQLERLRFEWTPAAGVPRPGGQLEFRPEPDDETFLAAFRQVSIGSLDVDTRTGVAKHGIDAQAREDMGVYQSMPGERDWWRLAYTPDGELAGLAIPSANPGGPVVGYLGVVPGMRGRGYVDELLAEITRFLAERGAPRILADTDNTNTPMADAFVRAGYRNFAVRLVVSITE